MDSSVFEIKVLSRRNTDVHAWRPRSWPRTFCHETSMPTLLWPISVERGSQNLILTLLSHMSVVEILKRVSMTNYTICLQMSVSRKHSYSSCGRMRLGDINIRPQKQHKARKTDELRYAICTRSITSTSIHRPNICVSRIPVLGRS
jgi:hypothetical protein